MTYYKFLSKNPVCLPPLKFVIVFRCIIGMGLDKKPTPPPKKGKEDNTQEQSASSPLDAPERDTERTGDDAASETGPSRDPEAKIQEQTTPGRDKARDGTRPDPMKACILQPDEFSVCVFPLQIMKKTLKQMMKAL